MAIAGWWLRGDDVGLHVVAERDILAIGRAREPPVDVSNIPSTSFFRRDTSPSVHELVARQEKLDGLHCGCDHRDGVLKQAEDSLGCADNPNRLEAHDFIALAVSFVEVCQARTNVGIAFERVLEQVPDAGGAVRAVAVGMAACAQEDGGVVGGDARAGWAVVRDPLSVWKLHCVRHGRQRKAPTAQAIFGLALWAVRVHHVRLHERTQAGFHRSSSDVGQCVHMISSTYSSHVVRVGWCMVTGVYL
jgi:hypothetical protein